MRVSKGDIKRILWLVILLLGLFGFLELKTPYLFLSGDNAAYYLPAYVYNWRAVVEHRTVPLITFHQLLGQTYLGQAQSAVLYPPIYVAVAISKLLFGHPMAVIDILAISHLVIGAIGMYVLLRYRHVPGQTALLTSALWVTFPLYIGQSFEWIIIPYLVAYVPWCWLLLAELAHKPTFGPVLRLAVVKSLWFFTGYPQLVVMLLEFEVLWLVIVMVRSIKSNSWRQAGTLARRYLLSMMLFFLFIAPLLFPLLNVQRVSQFRSSALSFDQFITHTVRIQDYLAAQLLYKSHGIPFYILYTGLPVFGLLALLFWRPATKLWRSLVPYDDALLALVAFLLATPLYGLFYVVPVLSLFRWPFKYLSFYHFFLALLVASVVAVLYRLKPSVLRSLAHWLLLVGISGNLVVLFNTDADLFDRHWNVSRQINTVPPMVEQTDNDGRWFLYKATYESETPYTAVLGFNHAQLYNRYHFAGHDPLIARLNFDLIKGDFWTNYTTVYGGDMSEELLDYLSKWSVKYLATSNTPENKAELGQFSDLKLIYEDSDALLFENLAVLPYAYEAETLEPVGHVTFGINAVHVRLDHSSEQREILLAVAPLPLFHYSIDDVKMGSIQSPENGPIKISVPPGAKEVRIYYVDYAFWLGVGLLASTWLGFGVWWILFKKV